jgi:predicted esterase
MPAQPFASRPAAALPAPVAALPGPHRIDLPESTGSGRNAWIHLPAGRQPGRPAPLAVMLHGSGGGPRQALQLLQPSAERAGAIVLAPASRGPTWDGVLGRIGPDWHGIDALLAWVFARHAIDPARVAIGGFSDGASYALSLALGNGELFTHAIALSPGFIPRAGVQGRPAVFVAHGTEDRVLPIAPCSRRIVPALERSGYAVTYREFAGGHEVPPPVAEAAVAWWLAGGAAG